MLIVCGLRLEGSRNYLSGILIISAEIAARLIPSVQSMTILTSLLFAQRRYL